MGEQGVRRFYAQLLQDVGARAGDMDGRLIASHLPFVGSRFGGTLIVGQALAGCDAAETSERPKAHSLAPSNVRSLRRRRGERSSIAPAQGPRSAAAIIGAAFMPRCKPPC